LRMSGGLLFDMIRHTDSHIEIFCIPVERLISNLSISQA